MILGFSVWFRPKSTRHIQFAQPLNPSSESGLWNWITLLDKAGSKVANVENTRLDKALQLFCAIFRHEQGVSLFDGMDRESVILGSVDI